MSSIPEKEINIIELISRLWSNKTTILSTTLFFIAASYLSLHFLFDAKTTYKYEVNFTNIAYDKYGLINQNIFVANKLIADQQGLLETDTMIINEARILQVFMDSLLSASNTGLPKIKVSKNVLKANSLFVILGDETSLETLKDVSNEALNNIKFYFARKIKNEISDLENKLAGIIKYNELLTQQRLAAVKALLAEELYFLKEQLEIARNLEKSNDLSTQNGIKIQPKNYYLLGADIIELEIELLNKAKSSNSIVYLCKYLESKLDFCDHELEIDNNILEKISILSQLKKEVERDAASQENLLNWIDIGAVQKVINDKLYFQISAIAAFIGFVTGSFLILIRKPAGLQKNKDLSNAP